MYKYNATIATIVSSNSNKSEPRKNIKETCKQKSKLYPVQFTTAYLVCVCVFIKASIFMIYKYRKVTTIYIFLNL